MSRSLESLLEPSAELVRFNVAVGYPCLQEAFSPPYVRKLLLPLAEKIPWKFEHSLRVARIVGGLHDFLGSPPEVKIQGIRAGLLHDIGSVDNPAIPLHVINKRKKLSDPELEGIQTHPPVGYWRVAPYDLPVAQILVGHHAHQGDYSYPESAVSKDGEEKFDPETVEQQRILAVADVTHALFDPNRIYKNPWSPEDVREELEKKFGKYFSSDFLDHAVSLGITHAHVEIKL